MTEKTLSLIIPAYNMETYLRGCLGSLVVSPARMEQLEVLVVNDGSSDKTSEVAHEWQRRYPRTVVAIDKENGNYGSCVNCGLSLATGKYVKVLDADDSFDTTALEKYLLFLHDVDADLIISDFCIVDMQGNVTETCTYSLPIDKPFSLSALSKRDVKWLWHHAIAYRTSILKSMSYRQTEGVSYTDDEWIFKPMTAVKSIRYFPHYLYRYLRGREGQTFDPKVLQKTFRQRMVVMESMLRFFASSYAEAPVEAQGYLRHKLLLRLESIYHYMLVANRNDENNRCLVDFDHHVKTLSADAYQMMDGVRDRLTGFRYIHTWRVKGYRYRIPTLFILYMKHKSRRIMKKMKLI